MKAEETQLKGCFVIHDTVFKDERGYFFESFNAKSFKTETGIDINFVQDNQSHSVKGVVRGIHFQQQEYAQAKLVRVLQGEVLDVAVDLRKSSPTFGKYFSILLTQENHTQLFIPRGFGHGFLVLSETVDFFYKCDNFYNKASEGGIIYNDPQINIDWKLRESDFRVSAKDAELPFLHSYSTLF